MKTETKMESESKTVTDRKDGKRSRVRERERNGRERGMCSLVQAARSFPRYVCALRSQADREMRCDIIF